MREGNDHENYLWSLSRPRASDEFYTGSRDTAEQKALEAHAQKVWPKEWRLRLFWAEAKP